jgi:hypothetical protein
MSAEPVVPTTVAMPVDVVPSRSRSPLVITVVVDPVDHELERALPIDHYLRGRAAIHVNPCVGQVVDLHIRRRIEVCARDGRLDFNILRFREGRTYCAESRQAQCRDRTQHGSSRNLHYGRHPAVAFDGELYLLEA